MPLAIAIIATASLTAMPASAVDWKGYHYTNVNTQPSYQALERIAADVEKASGGKVTFKLNVGGSLPIPATSITQAVGDGLLQFAADGFYTSSIPVGGIAFLPTLLATPAEFDAAYGALEPFLAEAYAKRGVKLLGHYRYPLQTVFANVPITSLADIAGKKARVTSAEQAEFVKRLGGTPVTIGSPEVATALQRGTINGIFTASSGGARGYREMLTHNYRFGPNFHLSLIIANAEAFGKLPPDVQKELVESTRKHGAWVTATYVEQELQFKEEYKKLGMVITEASKDDAGKAVTLMAGYWDEWAKAKGPVAEQALAKVRQAVQAVKK